MNNEICIFIGILIFGLLELSIELTRRRWRKQCKFNCNKCKVFDCPKLYCDRHREKIIKKRGIENEI